MSNKREWPDLEPLYESLLSDWVSQATALHRGLHACEVSLRRAYQILALLMPGWCAKLVSWAQRKAPFGVLYRL